MKLFVLGLFLVSFSSFSQTVIRISPDNLKDVKVNYPECTLEYTNERDFTHVWVRPLAKLNLELRLKNNIMLTKTYIDNTSYGGISVNKQENETTIINSDIFQKICDERREELLKSWAASTIFLFNSLKQEDIQFSELGCFKTVVDLIVDDKNHIVQQEVKKIATRCLN